MEIYNNCLSNYCNGKDTFIKSLYLNNYVVAFIYYREDNEVFHIELFKLN